MSTSSSSPPIAAATSAATAVADPVAAATAAAQPVSLWDFILGNQHVDVEQYLQRIAASDARDGTNLIDRILGQRVEQSVRFKFHHPVMGDHGYYHASLDPEHLRLLPKGTSPLHLAVRVRSSACVALLLQYCADLLAMDSEGTTAFRLALDIPANGKEKTARDELLQSFRTYRDVVQRQRRQLLVRHCLARHLCCRCVRGRTLLVLLPSVICIRFVSTLFLHFCVGALGLHCVLRGKDFQTTDLLRRER
jgi:hypothetical protein